MSAVHLDLLLERLGLMRLPLGVLLLVAAVWAVRNLREPRPLPVEWLLPVRGRWALTFLAVVPGVLAVWLLSPCMLFFLALPLLGARLSGGLGEWFIGQKSPRVRMTMGVIGLAAVLYFLVRPFTAVAVSPDGQLEARAEAGGWLPTLAELLYGSRTEGSLTRYSLIVRDRGTGERLVLTDEEHGSHLEDIYTPDTIKWKADNRTFTCAWAEFEFGTSDTYQVERNPLRLVRTVPD